MRAHWRTTSTSSLQLLQHYESGRSDTLDGWRTTTEIKATVRRKPRSEEGHAEGQEAEFNGNKMTMQCGKTQKDKHIYP